MNYRLATILDRELHSADTTKVIDINLADPVSQIVVIYEPLNGVPGTPSGHPAKCISKIEVVDGSDVLYSLSGQEAQGVDFYHRGKEPSNLLIYLPSQYPEQVFNLNFGRYLWDPTLAFHPKKFTNPQLKITVDVNGGGLNSVSGYLTVLARIFDQKAIDPIGFLMHKEIKDYAMASASHEYTDLPVDFPYRKLLIKMQKYAVGPDYCLDTIKLSEDNDRRIPLNHTIGQILKTLVGENRPYQEWILVEAATVTSYGYCTMAYWPTFTGTRWEAAAVTMSAAIYEGDGGRFKYDMADGGGNFQIHAVGWVPHGVIEIPFGLQNEIEDWYDVTKMGSLRLDIKSASGMASTDSLQIFLQQLRRYGGAA